MKTVARMFLFGMLWWLPAVPALAQWGVEIIPLSHRTAAEVIPVLEPLLQGRGTITGMDGQLIVRTTPENLGIIRQVLATIDRARRNLLITVRQGLSQDLRERSAEINVEGRLGHSAVIGVNPVPSGTEGLVGSGTAGGVGVRGRVLERNLDKNDTRVQKVRTLDGSPALIRIGLLVPFVQHRTHTSVFGTTESETAGFQNVTTGVSVLPRIQGDRVILEIQPQRSRLQPGGIQVQEIATTVSGRLGEWIEIGGLLQERIETQGQILGQSGTQGTESRRVFLKVEEVP